MNIRAFLLPIGVWQGVAHYKQALERQVKYEAARAYADSIGKPLLVVGGPWGANPFRSLLKIPAHGCGDVCIDIHPEACEGCSNTVEADIRDIPFPDKYFGAALASHILEHLPTVDNCERAISELHRVANAVYVAGPSKQSILAWLIPEHRLWVTQKQDGAIEIEQR